MAFNLALTQLFNEIWVAMVWPSQWRLAHLIPLYKKSGDTLDPSNYRMLALMSVLPKLFEKVLDARLREWADRVSALSDLQGGFRAKSGTIDQMFILNEILSSRKEARPVVLMCVH